MALRYKTDKPIEHLPTLAYDIKIIYYVAFQVFIILVDLE